MTVVLSIDQGTSSTKAVVVDETGDVLGVAEVDVSPRYSGGGRVEQDPRELFGSILEAGRTAAAQSRTSIDVVSLANQGETVLAWDPVTGEPLSDMLVWQDTRAQDICARLADGRPLIEERTGLVLDPYFSAPKQAWIRENITRDGVITTSDSWILHQLTGEFVTDASTASRSLVTDLDTVSWNDELLDLFGLGGEALPNIVASDSLIGATDAFGAKIAVGGVIVDQQAALAAETCLRPGEAKCTFGTGAFLLVNTGHSPARSTSGLSTSVAWKTASETAFCLDGQVYTAASAVRWLQQLGFITSASDLDRIAATDAEGVLSVPALAGLASPWWRSDVKASFSGMTLSTGPEHLVFAVVQGIAAQVAELGASVATDVGEPLQRLRVDGGLTRSRVLMQAVADIMQVEVDVFPTPHATALGAAAFGRMAHRPGLPLADAIVKWQPRESFEPTWPAERAAEFRRRWNSAVEASLMTA